MPYVKKKNTLVRRKEDIDTQLAYGKPAFSRGIATKPGPNKLIHWITFHFSPILHAGSARISYW